ncbi:GntR family transcriptional regulator [Altericroceibacterium spongiae]|uniref:GntR family transcriptional regulator n=1 Tax=Altericroceibacterium spongiae TaxID=2320269 RepID=A0A420EAJ1_9SPHN|nr:GntR family transcriptional regulator [Altericroceibacterium spongiae]RKF17717.1 GntR family transcriptional regulator [Altericroceibacterium spongiae]
MKNSEELYMELRRAIMGGVISAGALSSQEIADDYGVSQRQALQVLNTLASDGYLRKTRTQFFVTEWSAGQVTEWLDMLTHMVSMGAIRHSLNLNDDISQLATIREAMMDLDVSDEEYYLKLINYISILLGAPRSRLAELTRRLVPSAFLRLVWTADIIHSTGPVWLPFMEELEEAIRSASRVAIDETIRSHMHDLAPGIETARANRFKIIPDKGSHMSKSTVREHDLSDQLTPMGAPRRSFFLLCGFDDRKKTAVSPSLS